MVLPDVPNTLTEFPPELRANPVFRLEYRRLHWPRTPQEFNRYRRLVLWTVAGLTFVWWLLARLTTNRMLFVIEYGNQMVLLFLLSTAFSLVSSFYSMVTTISSIHQQVETGNWENLQITPLTSTAIVNAYYALLQIRARRLCIIESGLRMATFMPLIFDLIYALFFTRGGFTTVFILVFPPVLLAFGTLGWLIYMYLIEPYYRMLIIVAVSLAAVLTLHTFIGALVAGLIFMGIVHTAPLIVLIAVPVALTATSDIARLTGPALVCLIPLGYIAAAYLLFNGYHWLRERALVQAVQKAT